MEDQKCHMKAAVTAPLSAASFCVADVLQQLRETPETFSIMPASAKGGGDASTRTWAVSC